MASKQGAKIVSTGYVDDVYGAYPCVKVQHENTEPCKGLKSYIGKKDEIIIPLINQAEKDGYQRALALENDTDVFLLL